MCLLPPPIEGKGMKFKKPLRRRRGAGTPARRVPPLRDACRACTVPLPAKGFSRLLLAKSNCLPALHSLLRREPAILRRIRNNGLAALRRLIDPGAKTARWCARMTASTDIHSGHLFLLTQILPIGAETMEQLQAALASTHRTRDRLPLNACNK